MATGASSGPATEAPFDSSACRQATAPPPARRCWARALGAPGACGYLERLDRFARFASKVRGTMGGLGAHARLFTSTAGKPASYEASYVFEWRKRTPQFNADELTFLRTVSPRPARVTARGC
jgi:hypothetical protein